MKITNSNMRSFLVFVFALAAIASFLVAAFSILISAFGVGWGGGSTTTGELVWANKGLLLASIFCLFTAIGLKKQKAYGIQFGYAVAISYLIYVVYFQVTMISFGSELGEKTSVILKLVSQLLIALIIPALVLFGVHRLRKETEDFGLQDYVNTAGLILILSLALMNRFGV